MKILWFVLELCLSLAVISAISGTSLREMPYWKWGLFCFYSFCISVRGAYLERERVRRLEANSQKLGATS